METLSVGEDNAYTDFIRSRVARQPRLYFAEMSKSKSSEDELLSYSRRCKIASKMWPNVKEYEHHLALAI